jgi:hypothetical protein
MYANSLVSGLASLLLALSCTQVHALDAYDGANLRIPMVSVGATVYLNVVTGVAGIVSVEGGAPRGNFDSYNAGSALLFIPSVVYGGTTYTNVTVNVGLPNVSHVGGVLASPSFVVIANPNDQTIRSYAYGVGTTSQAATPISTVADTHLARLKSGRSPKLFLDKPNGLLFDAVLFDDGTAALAVYSMNPATGTLTPLPAASIALQGSEGSVDVFNHQVIVVGPAGVALYPYDTATGVLQAASLVSSDPVFQDVFGFDPVDRLLFASDGKHMSTYTFAPSSQPVLAAQVAAPIDSNSAAQDVTGRFDLARKFAFVADTPTETSATTLTAAVFSASSVATIGSQVVTANASFCGVDPFARLLFLAPNNGSPGLNMYAYATSGVLSALPAPFTPLSTSGAYGGACKEIDPVNHIIFFASNFSPAEVSFYTYDTVSGSVNMAPLAAGVIGVTAGPGTIEVLSTQALGLR